MNLLEFPNEILFEFCKNMDFKTRVNFRKVCTRTHALLINPKYIVTKDKVEEWNNKMKMITGMILLDNMIPISLDGRYLSDYVVLKSPSDNLKYLRLAIDENYEFFMTCSYRAIQFLRHFKIKNENYQIRESDTTMIDNTLFSKYKLNKHRYIFDDGECIGAFLYDLYISFICFDQKKNEERIAKTQLSNLIKITLNHPLNFYPITNQTFRTSSYFEFSNGSKMSGSFFKDNIERFAIELQKDLSRYFMDGEEAEKFLSA
jgi:hypothetical protein